MHLTNQTPAWPHFSVKENKDERKCHYKPGNYQACLHIFVFHHKSKFFHNLIFSFHNNFRNQVFQECVLRKFRKDNRSGEVEVKIKLKFVLGNRKTTMARKYRVKKSTQYDDSDFYDVIFLYGSFN